MAEALLVLTIGIFAAILLALCGRGTRIPGPSWFDMPHDTNRASRRAQHG